MATLRIAGIIDDSIVDGPGVRYTIFLQGCAHGCAECHNPQTHDYNGGHIVPFDEILIDIKKNKYLKGITFSGGEPLDQAESLAEFINILKHDHYHVIIYTGYTYEVAIKDKLKLSAIKNADVLIDGRFDINQKTLSLPFRGSSNQRAIDIQKSLKCGDVTPIEL